MNIQMKPTTKFLCTYDVYYYYYEHRFAQCCWISVATGGSPGWALRVRGTLTYREDTGLINSSPVVNIPSLIRLQHGCNHTIKIPGGELTYVAIITASAWIK